ncbi:hypothetical protein [uncultured Campylobacter sp.]|nr:hypothetical protein [uncultured Campylobacter sp.]
MPVLKGDLPCKVGIAPDPLVPNFYLFVVYRGPASVYLGAINI